MGGSSKACLANDDDLGNGGDDDEGQGPATCFMSTDSGHPLRNPMGRKLWPREVKKMTKDTLLVTTKIQIWIYWSPRQPAACECWKKGKEHWPVPSRDRHVILIFTDEETEDQSLALFSCEVRPCAKHFAYIAPSIIMTSL